jgi:hypothetical protein
MPLLAQRCIACPLIRPRNNKKFRHVAKAPLQLAFTNLTCTKLPPPEHSQSCEEFSGEGVIPRTPKDIRPRSLSNATTYLVEDPVFLLIQSPPFISAHPIINSGWTGS